MIINFNAGAGSKTEFNEQGDFFRIMAAVSAIDVFFYRAGREIARAEGVTAGYAERFNEPYDKVLVVSAAAQALQLANRLGNQVSFDAPPTGNVTGSVSISSLVPTQSAAPTQAAATVTTASAQLKAAKADRKYLLIQNNDAAGIIYVNVAGAAATAANGIKIAPGGSYEQNCNITTAAVFAIGSIASNANVVVVEG